MKQEALFRKLGNILSELNEQYQFLSQNPEQLSELELELFLANANFLSDHIQIIKKLNLPLQAPATTKQVTQEPEQPFANDEISDELKDVQQVEAITFAEVESQDEIVAPLTPIFEGEEETASVPAEEPERELFKLDIAPTQSFEFILNKDGFSEDDKFDFEEKTAEELFDRPLSKEEEFVLQQKKKVKENLIRDPESLEEDEIGPEPFLVHHGEEEELKVEEKEIVPEPVVAPVVVEAIPAPAPEVTKVVVQTTKVEFETEQKLTLNDILAGNNNGSRVNDTSMGAAVADLKSAINLNDKLLYIKDLFNGYNLAYAEAIDIANKMPNFDAADNFFQKNYAVKNNWADKQTTVDKFYLLLNRRFKD